jgi:hypothetical protein
LKQIEDFPAKDIIQKWLKAGFIDNNVFNMTESGTPQGGIISPVLANIALHGMEAEIGVKYRFTKRKTGKIQNEIVDTKTVVRYADDFVILCETKREAMSMYEKLKPYLEKRGLELAPEKTKVSHISEGFDFLGFNFRQYPVNKIKGQLWKMLIRPNIPAEHRHRHEPHQRYGRLDEPARHPRGLRPADRAAGRHRAGERRDQAARLGVRSAPLNRRDGSRSWNVVLRRSRCPGTSCGSGT